MITEAIKTPSIIIEQQRTAVTKIMTAALLGRVFESPQMTSTFIVSVSRRPNETDQRTFPLSDSLG